jgi:hypothetical protein
MLRSYLSNQKGAALVLVLVAMVVLTILSIALLDMSVADAMFSARGEKNTKAHYLGRSGVTAGLEMLRSKVPYDNDITDLVDELNVWAATVSPVQLSTTEEFTIAYELIGPREIKITSEGKIIGTNIITDIVTLRVKMLTSLLSGGKAQEWYVSHNSHNLVAGNDPAAGGHTYLGQGVFFEGKNNSATHFPSNAPGTSIFQASVLQFLENSNGVCLGYSGTVQDTTFDAEIFIFNGIIRMNSTLVAKLSLSEEVARNKINNTPPSVLYVSNSAVRTEIVNNGDPGGVGFENLDYYEYFIGGTYADHALYPFAALPYTRYGVAYFGDKVVRASTDAHAAGAANRLPTTDPAIYATGYFYFPHDININGDLSGLIPIRKDDPIVSLIEVITKVTMSTEPFIWDEK